MSIHAIQVLALLMDNKEGLSVVELKQRTQGKNSQTEDSFDRMISDLVGLGCAYICRYQHHIPVLKLQEKRFEQPNAPDTYTGLEARSAPNRFKGLRYRTVITLKFEGKLMSAWAACQLAGIPYRIMWSKTTWRVAIPNDSDYQETFDQLFEHQRVSRINGVDPWPPAKRLDHKRKGSSEKSVFSGSASVFNTVKEDPRLGSQAFIEVNDK